MPRSRGRPRDAACRASPARIAQSAKSVAGEVRKRATPALESTLPTVSLLKDADDRGYVAKACGWAIDHWVIDCAVQAIAEEETAEKVRAEFIRVLFARAGSLANAFSRLSKALARLKPETESPADSVAKRLTHVLAGLREAVVTSLIPPGEDAGESLGDLVSNPFSSLGLPGNRDVGAGTTDLGLFMIREWPETETPRVFQIPRSVCGFRQAGDTIDKFLRAAILKKHGSTFKTVTGNASGRNST